MKNSQVVTHMQALHTRHSHPDVPSGADALGSLGIFTQGGLNPASGR